MAEETKQEIKTPRLYKRGNENVDLDLYILDAGTQMDFFLANSKLKADLKKEVKSAFDKMIQGINDNTVQYIVGGGFDNSLGIKNSNSDFDASGIAAGLLGKVLRLQKAIADPEEEKKKQEEEKTKSRLSTYQGRESIGNKILGDILGDTSKEGLQQRLKYFIYKDPYVNGKRALTERLKILTQGLADFAGSENWDNYFSGYDQSDIDQWKKDYETFLKNVNIEDGLLENEYLDLARLLGLNNIEALFFTGESYDPTKPIAQQDGSETPAQTAKRRISEGYDLKVVYDSWLNQTHPKNPSIQLSEDINIPSVQIHKDDKVMLLQALSTIGTLDLLEIFEAYMYNPDFRLNTDESIATALGGIYDFSDDALLSEIADVLISRNVLSNLGDNSYYVPINGNGLNEKGLGITYKRNSDGTGIISEKHQQDIPYFLNQWYNEFQSSMMSLKLGGNLVPKFANSGKIKKIDGGHNYYYNGQQYDTDHGSWINNWLGNLTPEQLGDVKLHDIQKRLLDAWYDNGVDEYYGLTPEEQLNLYENAGIAGFLKDFDDNTYGLINYLGGENHSSFQSNSLKRVNKDSYTNDGHRKLYDDYIGGITNSRRAALHTNVTGDELNRYDDNLKKFGYTGRYKYRNHWIGLNDDTDLTGIDPNDIVKFEVPVPEETPEVQETPLGEETPQGDHVGEVPNDLDSLVAEMLGFNPNTMLDLKGQSIWEQIGPGLASDWLGLGLTLRGNRIGNKQLKNWHLHQGIVPERYAPTTGLFNVQQSGNADIANMVSNVTRRATADSLKNDAAYLEAWDRGLKHKTQLNLMDDRELKRTSAIDREYRWEGQKGRAANFNDYMNKLMAREKEFGQIDASKTKLDTSSIVNALQSSLLRFDKQRNVNRTKLESAYESYVNDYATQLHNDFINPLKQQLSDWLAVDGNTTDNWVDANGRPLYDTYNRLNNYSQLLSKSLAASKIYPLLGLTGYENPYAGGMDMFYNIGSLGWVDRYSNPSAYNGKYVKNNNEKKA